MTSLSLKKLPVSLWLLWDVVFGVRLGITGDLSYNRSSPVLQTHWQLGTVSEYPLCLEVLSPEIQLAPPPPPSDTITSVSRKFTEFGDMLFMAPAPDSVTSLKFGLTFRAPQAPEF